MQVADTNLHTSWQTIQIQKPIDLDLQFAKAGHIWVQQDQDAPTFITGMLIMCLFVLFWFKPGFKNLSVVWQISVEHKKITYLEPSLNLLFPTLWANSADDKLVTFFLFFLENRFDILGKLFPMETICMKCQILFSGKDNKRAMMAL